MRRKKYAYIIAKRFDQEKLFEFWASSNVHLLDIIKRSYSMNIFFLDYLTA